MDSLSWYCNVIGFYIEDGTFMEINFFKNALGVFLVSHNLIQRVHLGNLAICWFHGCAVNDILIHFTYKIASKGHNMIRSVDCFYFRIYKSGSFDGSLMSLSRFCLCLAYNIKAC